MKALTTVRTNLRGKKVEVNTERLDRISAGAVI